MRIDRDKINCVLWMEMKRKEKVTAKLLDKLNLHCNIFGQTPWESGISGKYSYFICL